VKHDILNFEIPMHSLDLVKSSETVENLFQINQSYWFWQSPFFLQQFSEISLITIVEYHEDMAFLGETFMHFDNVRVVAFFEDVDFGIGEFSDFRSRSKLFFGDDFDSVFPRFGGIEPFVDMAPIALSYYFGYDDVFISENSTVELSLHHHMR
jgi:hypothetical protein